MTRNASQGSEPAQPSRDEAFDRALAEAARVMREAVEAEPVDPRLQALAVELGEALERRQTEEAGSPPVAGVVPTV